MSKLYDIITEDWLRSKNACEEDIEWVLSKNTTSTVEILSCAHEEPECAKWLLKNIGLSKKQAVKVAIFSAELCLKDYKGEEKKVLVEAIQAAKDVVENDTEENRESAADAAWAAVSATERARNVRRRTAWAADAARASASAAARESASAAARPAAWAAASAVSATAMEERTWKKILAYTIEEVEA